LVHAVDDVAIGGELADERIDLFERQRRHALAVTTYKTVVDGADVERGFARGVGMHGRELLGERDDAENTANAELSLTCKKPPTERAHVGPDAVSPLECGLRAIWVLAEALCLVACHEGSGCSQEVRASDPRGLHLENDNFNVLQCKTVTCLLPARGFS